MALFRAFRAEPTGQGTTPPADQPTANDNDVDRALFGPWDDTSDQQQDGGAR